MLRPRRPALALVLLPFLVSLGSAQVRGTDTAGSPSTFWDPANFGTDKDVLRWTGPDIFSGNFGKIVSGDLTGDGVPEAVTLVGNQAVMAYQPALFTGLTPIGDSVNDIAYLPVEGEAGALLLVGPVGLQVWALGDNPLSATGGNGTLDPNDPFTVTDTAWENARLIETAQLGIPSSPVDFVGLAADGHTILVRIVGPTGTVSVGSGFVSTNEVLDIEVFDWDQDAAREIALVTTAGLAVFELDGTPETAFPSVQAGVSVTAFREDQQGHDRLAWITWSGVGAGQVLTIVDSAGTLAEEPLGAVDATSLQAGDFDHDGFEDLVIGHRSANTLLLLLNQHLPFAQGGSGMFEYDPTDPAETMVLALGSDNMGQPIAVQGSHPMVADLDLDGQPDILAGSPPDEYLRIFRGNELITLNSQSSAFSDPGYEQDVGFGEFQVTVELPELPTATHVEAVVWRQRTPYDYIDSTAVYHCQQVYGENPVDLTVEIPETGYPFNAVYYVEVRQVELDGGGALVRAGSAEAGGLTMKLLNVPILEAMPGAGDTLDIYTTEFIGGTLIGGFVTNEGRIQFFQPGQIQDAGPPVSCP